MADRIFDFDCSKWASLYLELLHRSQLAFPPVLEATFKQQHHQQVLVAPEIDQGIKTKIDSIVVVERVTKDLIMGHQRRRLKRQVLLRPLSVDREGIVSEKGRERGKDHLGILLLVVEDQGGIEVNGMAVRKGV